MRYLGMDVHAKSTVWCLVDQQGEVRREGKVATTAAALTALVQELGRDEELLAGQEVGTLTYLVYDALTAAGTRILSFNAHQLRMIAASRKKTDRRDAYWIAKALQSGMYPASGLRPDRGDPGTARAAQPAARPARGLPAVALSGAGLSARRGLSRGGGDRRVAGGPRARERTDGGVPGRRPLSAAGGDTAGGTPARGRGAGEPGRVDRRRAAAHDDPRHRRACRDRDLRLGGRREALPDGEEAGGLRGVGPDGAAERDRGPRGRHHEAGGPGVAAGLVQASHVLLARCRRAEAAPLQTIGLRIRGSRGRRKIAVVALARHLLRIAYYILRDGTTYDAVRLRTMTDAA